MWLAIEKAIKLPLVPEAYKLLRWSTTFLIVLFGWVLFRAESLSDALTVYGSMFSGSLVISEGMWAATTSLQWFILIFSVLVIFYPFWGNAVWLNNVKRSLKHPMIMSTSLGVAFVVVCLKLSAQSYSPFLYFQF